MKKNKCIVIATIITLFLLVGACTKINDGTVLKREQYGSNTKDIKQKEKLEVKPKFKNTYKLFFGEWEIKRVIGYNNKLGETLPEFSSNIGKKIFYGNDKIECDNLSLDNFLYSYTILPNEKNECYFYNTLTNEQLGVSGKYYVFVHVETFIKELGYDSTAFIGDEFFINDDNTLILVKYGVFYLAERVSHIYKDDIEKRILNSHI